GDRSAGGTHARGASVLHRDRARSRYHAGRRGRRRRLAPGAAARSDDRGHAARRGDSRPLRTGWSAMRKYLAFARIAARQALSQRAQFYGPVAFVGVILGVFSALWRAVGEAGMPLGLDHAAAVWYLAATEWILMSAPQVHLDIEGEIRR